MYDSVHLLASKLISLVLYTAHHQNLGVTCRLHLILMHVGSVEQGPACVRQSSPLFDFMIQGLVEQGEPAGWRSPAKQIQAAADSYH